MSHLKKILLTTLLLLITTPSLLLARAGGGGGFHGGGGGGFGGGGGGFGGGGGWGGGSSHSYSSGSGSSNWGVVLFFLAAIALYLFINYLQNRGSPITFSSDDDNQPLSTKPFAAETNAIALLQKSDPSFCPETFYFRLNSAFLAIQSAWSNQNLAPVRPFISDAIGERFTLQFDEQKFLGYTNPMTNVRVQSIKLVQVTSDHLFDTATVCIHAAAIDQKINADGSLREGSRAPEPFTEFWSFLRRRGAKSIPKGLIEGNCPNCGAAIEINQNTACPHCQASLRSAQYDWVLTEITQAEEYHPTPSAPEIPGLTTLLNRDPNFTLTDLEDRTSVMFWRLSLADRTASIDPLRKIAVPALLEKYPAKFTPDDQGFRRIYLDAGVGSVTTLNLLPGDPTDPASSDHALLEIRWSGILYVISPTTTPRKTNEDNLIYSWYLLKRSATAQTKIESTISSTHCPNCGAPLTNDASNTCEYCHTPLTDGSHGWLLDHITRRNDPSILAFLHQTETPDPT